MKRVRSLTDQFKYDVNLRYRTKLAAAVNPAGNPGIFSRIGSTIKGWLPGSWGEAGRGAYKFLTRHTYDPDKSFFKNVGGNMLTDTKNLVDRVVRDYTGSGLGTWRQALSPMENSKLPLMSQEQAQNRLFDAAKKKYDKRWTLKSFKDSATNREDLRSAVSDATMDHAINSATSSGMTGALGGAAIGGIGGALTSDDKDRFRNGMMGAMAGAGLGGVGGAAMGGLNAFRRGNALKSFVRNGGVQFNGNGDVVTLNTAGRLANTFLPQNTFNDLGWMQRFLYNNHGNADQFAYNMLGG